MSTSAEAFISVVSLGGNVLAELKFDVGRSVRELKEHVLPLAAPHATQSAKLMLLFDGAEPDDGQTLSVVGVVALERAHFTALVHDPELMAKAEIEDMYRCAVERSRRDAAEARKARAEKREMILAERSRQLEAEEDQERPQGPLLMLTAEPGGLVPLAAPEAAAEEVKERPQGPLLMLTAEPAGCASPQLAAIEDCPVAASTAPSDTACLDAAAAVPPAIARDWRSEAAAVAAAYGSFFEHISFRKGWKEPPFTRVEAADAFADAARVVARARLEVLDRRDAGFKLRQVEGSARDWMHAPERGQLLRDEPDLFVSGLVHATFSDAKGYTEGLCQSEVDEFLKLYR